MKLLHLSKDSQLSSKLLTLQVRRVLDSENFMLSARILDHAYMSFSLPELVQLAVSKF
jgi:hypothetical protein